jgi:hypothetical protein
VQLLINPKPIGGVTMSDFFDDGFDFGDAALLGGIFGYAQEEERERRRLEEEFEKDEPKILPCTDCDPSSNDEDFIP